MEVIDIGLRDVESISLNLNENEYKPSVNFGPGVELLMNDKKKNSFSNTNVDLGDLDKLEQDLNDLTTSGSSAPSASSTSKSLNFGNWFGGGSSSGGIQLNVEEVNDSHLGEATAQSGAGMTRTTDGFSRLNTEIPLDYSSVTPSSSSSHMTDREKRRKKRMMIRKMEEWYEKGIIKTSSHFNMDSAYEEVEDEYEGALEDKRKKDSVKLYGWWFMTFVNSVEYANAAFNPFDVNLDGWGEQVSEDLDSYDELFGELYQKYKGGKLSPEISLLMRLGFSAAVVNFTNKALSSATPAFNDVIRQSPELMKMFTNATVQSMSNASPGFNMANNMMNQEPEVNRTFGAPPPPVATKNQAPPARHPMSSMQFTRPDLEVGRGNTAPMFRESGVDLQQERSSYTSSSAGPPPPMQSMGGSGGGGGPRPEMRGPQVQNVELNQILSGLKTRGNQGSVGDSSGPNPMQSFFGGGVQPQQQQQQESMNQVRDDSFAQMQHQMHDLSPPPPSGSVILNENDSMISVTSLRDMQNATMPKRARRKQRSDRNTISLDI